MNIQRATPVNDLLAKLIFLMLPTAGVMYTMLQHVQEYFSILQNDSLKFLQKDTLVMALTFAVGMGMSAIFYAFRFRFWPTFLLLLFGAYFALKGLDSIAVGEMDGPFIHVKFILFSTLFSLGWLNGWGFLRVRYWSVGVSAALLVGSIYLIAKGQTDTVDHLFAGFAPVVIFSVYLIFTAEQIYSYRDKSKKFWCYMGSRVAGFVIVACLLFGAVWLFNKKKITETVANFGGAGGKGGDNSMLKGKKDGTFDLKDYSQLRSQLGRSNELLFCAHIDNFFPNSDVPNPLYLIAFYFTKFDTTTETFERDSLIPNNDLFEPNPSQVPLFGTKTDTSVLRNSGTQKLGKEVEIQVYSRKLSPTTYLAPHTGFFVQPITVEKDFRDSFKTAFRAKSYVSELNSAYFVYNITKKQNPDVAKFQEMRFALLRKAPDYTGMPKAFMSYYTSMPQDLKFKKIADLAQQVTAKAKTPVDKVLAIRDYFLSKDPSGKSLYKYTDNPGVPDIPNASKLQYFLFENHKGYCAYFAGATLFMLRSLGIPSRIAAGFLTEDRSGGKNKGWYWYYANQAHAWVQVYFPGYGWLDFDTTIGNEDAHQGPKTDGTPPTQPPHAWLAADGLVVSTDTVTKKMIVSVRHFVFRDRDYTLPAPVTAEMDMKIAAVQRDSIAVPLSEIQKGEEATVVSYADAFKNIATRDGEPAASLLKRFPSPEPIDEVYLKRIEQREKQEPPKAAVKQIQSFSWKRFAIATCIIAALLILLFFLLPVLIFQYFRTRAGSAKDASGKSYYTYRAAMFYLNQLGFARGGLTPLRYSRDMIDPALGTNLFAFMIIYLKQKFAQQQLNERETTEVSRFLLQFLKTARNRIPAGTRFGKFLNPLRAISFFMQPPEEEPGD